jgi:hypothetical protein
MANVATPRGEIVVDSRGRTSLARVRTHAYNRYTVTEDDDGRIILTPAITVSPADARAAGLSPAAETGTAT